jgi:AcrR family transcriptional regulator
MAPKIVDKEARRQAVLAAAAAVFAKFGYQRATMAQVAEAAGVAKGSVYLSFASKEDLFYALFENLAKEATEGSVSLPEGATALAQIEEIMCAAAEVIEANEIIVPLTLEFWSVCGVEQTRDRFGRKSAEMFDEFRSRIVAILKHGQARGEVAADAPLAEVASCVISMIDGLLVQQWADASVSMSKTLRRALPVLLGGLKRTGT